MFFAKRTICALASVLALSACDSVFGDNSAKNEKDMSLVVERFLAEQDAALTGNRLGIADRISKMSSIQLDLKAIDATERCKKFQDNSLTAMGQVVGAWKDIVGNEMPDSSSPEYQDSCYSSLGICTSTGSIFLQLNMLGFEQKQAKLVEEAKAKATALDKIFRNGCELAQKAQ